jgi:hypothetical protein
MASSWRASVGWPEPNPALPRIFISCADEFLPAVNDIMNGLNRCGFDVQGGPLALCIRGPQAEEQREELLRHASVLLPLVTADYSASPRAWRELQLALQLGLRVGPVWHSGPYPPPLFMKLGVANAAVPAGMACGYAEAGISPDTVAGQAAAALAPDHFRQKWLDMQHPPPRPPPPPPDYTHMRR